jgi:hypothetical protein
MESGASVELLGRCKNWIAVWVESRTNVPAHAVQIGKQKPATLPTINIFRHVLGGWGHVGNRVWQVVWVVKEAPVDEGVVDKGFQHCHDAILLAPQHAHHLIAGCPAIRSDKGVARQAWPCGVTGVQTPGLRILSLT